jgi:outer membrane protein assembly factor BamE (lipoprotein component of BamABCDE complex)
MMRGMEGFHMRFSRFFLALVLAGLMMGCVSVGRKIDQSSADSIKKGVTTREQVTSLLGSPDGITRLGTGDTLYSYGYMRMKAKPASFIPIVGMFAGGAETQHQFFTVTFGPDGVVKDFYSTQGGLEADRGVMAGGKASTPEVEAGKRPK